jgi:acetyl esterase/lipase
MHYKLLTIMYALLLIPTPLFADQLSWYFNTNDINSLHSADADYKATYGRDPLQYADLRVPSGNGPWPVVIILHGGCWRSQFATAQNTAALADALRSAGYATYNIEYRSEDNAGGGWPGTFKDVAKAADLLPTLASKYNLDLNHIVAIGHSAGSQLALWLAARHNLPRKSSLYSSHPLVIQGVVTLGGIPDLAGWREHGKEVCGGDVVSALLGNTQTISPALYQQTSPMELLPIGVPQILIFGTDDGVTPEQYSENYLAAAKAKGDSVDVVEVKDGGHHEYITPNSIAWPAVKSAIQTLMQQK